MSNEQIPPGALILHTPWMTDAKKEYVGAPGNPLLVQCTEMSEVERTTPVICNMFLSWDNLELFQDLERNTPSEDIEAIVFEKVWDHNHTLHHSHGNPPGIVELKIDSTKKVMIDDPDNGESTKNVADFYHTHRVTLSDGGKTVGEEARGEKFEPVHHEVSSYWVREDARAVAAPIGMIAFRTDFVDSLDGWQMLDNKEGLVKDPRDLDSFYIPKVWDNVTLKVVGCTPKKERQGTRSHNHYLEGHTHSILDVSNQNKDATVDIDSDDMRTVAKDHTHPVSLSLDFDKLFEAENLRRNRKVSMWIAKIDGAKIASGMLLPYVAKNSDMSADLVNFVDDTGGTWQVEPISDATDSGAINDPLFLTSLDVPNRGNTGQIVGKNYHSHRYDHSHTLSVGPMKGTTFSTGDEQKVVCSSPAHSHDPVELQQVGVQSGENRNSLQYRRVSFIRYENARG